MWIVWYLVLVSNFYLLHHYLKLFSARYDVFYNLLVISRVVPVLLLTSQCVYEWTFLFLMHGFKRTLKLLNLKLAFFYKVLKQVFYIIPFNVLCCQLTIYLKLIKTHENWTNSKQNPTFRHLLLSKNVHSHMFPVHIICNDCREWFKKAKFWPPHEHIYFRNITLFHKYSQMRSTESVGLSFLRNESEARCVKTRREA